MKILFYFGHPAQFLFAKNSIKELKKRGSNTHILIKSKDVLEELVSSAGFKYTNILSEGRKDSTTGIILGLLKRDWGLFQYVLKNDIDIMVGTDPALAHIGKLFKIPVITVLEDDADVIPKLAKLTYPFTDHIFTPRVCRVGKKYKKKKLAYDGYMKLGYLHPNYFSPELEKKPNTNKPYILIRLAKLTAHHDDNITGLDFSLVDSIKDITGDYYQIYINSEYPLPDRYEKFRLKTDPKDIHHVLNYANLFISDSQSMTVEAAMLGVPNIRYSDFSGRISVLEELEHKYRLTKSLKPPAKESFLETIKKMLSSGNLKDQYQKKRGKMLNDKVDVTKLLTDLITDYPSSLNMFD